MVARTFMCLQLMALSGILQTVRSAGSERLVYRDDMITSSGSRQLVSLGGLFPFHEDSECRNIRKSSVERAEAMVFGIRAVNANSSLLPRVHLTFDIRDTCANSNVALERAIEYVQSENVLCTCSSDGNSSNSTNNNNNESKTLAVSGIVGAAKSHVSASLASLFRLFQVPQISYASTASLLSDKTRFDYFFRTISTDALQTRAMADLIAHFNWTYIFALHSDNTYGEEGIESLLRELQEQNDTERCIAILESLPSAEEENTGHFDSVAEKMSRSWVSNASVAVLFGHVGEATKLMDAINRLENRSPLRDITWIASDSWALNLPQQYHQQARGMLSILPKFRRVVEFEEYFTGLTPDNSSTGNPWFGEYWESVFNCSLGSTCDLQSQRLSSDEINEKVSYTIDAVNAFARALEHMITDHCTDGIVCDEIVTTRSVGEVIDGELLREYLFDITLPGRNESLFDANGDVQGAYLIQNLQPSRDGEGQYSFVPVGTWDHIDLLQLTEQIWWNTGDGGPPQSVCSLPCGSGHQPHRVPEQDDCCRECQPCLGDNSVSSGEEQCYRCPEFHMPDAEKSSCINIPVTYFRWSMPWAIVVLSFSCIGLVMAITVAMIFLVFRKNKVIKASSRELSAILLGGILLCYVLPALFVIKPSPALCGVRRFAIGFCFAISYSALLVRSNRIHRIFNQSTNRAVSKPPRFISATSQVVLTCILIFVQVVIAVVWLAVEHPSVQIEQVDSRTVELKCGESPYYGIAVSLCYNLFLLLLSTYFAFLTRNVPDNFNEAKFINITLYSLCIIWVVFVPTYFVSAQFGTVYENFFLLLAVLLSASITLVCLLVTKVFVMFLKWKDPMTTKDTITGHLTRSSAM